MLKELLFMSVFFSPFYASAYINTNQTYMLQILFAASLGVAFTVRAYRASVKSEIDSADSSFQEEVITAKAS